MGGADKGLVEWRGEPLAAHALRRLGPQVAAVAVNANRNFETYAGLGAPVWPDADVSFPGPLAGLLSGLTHCATDWLVTVPCDSPLFPVDLVMRLAAAAAQAASPIAMAVSAEGEAQPVFLLVHTRLRHDLAAALAGGERRVRRWAGSHGAAMAIFDTPGAFANANTAHELAGLKI
jgi:molybdopterin-guanine dinucleotide biosynthesis protein A